MSEAGLRVFLVRDKDIAELNKDNEWLAALLSGEALKEPKPKSKKKELRMVSNNQRRAIGR